MPSAHIEVSIAGVCTEIDRPAIPSDDLRQLPHFEDRWQYGDLRFMGGYAYVATIGGHVMSQKSGPVPWGYPDSHAPKLGPSLGGGHPYYAPAVLRQSLLLAEVCALYAFIYDVDIVEKHVRILTSSKRMVEYFTGKRPRPREAPMRKLIQWLAQELNAKVSFDAARNQTMQVLRRRRSSDHEPTFPIGPASAEIVYIAEIRNQSALGLAATAQDPRGGADYEPWIEIFLHRFSSPAV